jgi:hypothetical protein
MAARDVVVSKPLNEFEKDLLYGIYNARPDPYVSMKPRV